MYSGQNPPTSAKTTQGLHSENTHRVDVFCMDVEGSVHDCTRAQCGPETGPRVDIGLCQLCTLGKQRVLEQQLQ